MSEEVNTNDAEVFHARANHEDTLLTRRLTLLLVFNSFIAIAVGMQIGYWVKVIFSIVAIIIGLFWMAWSRNAKIFIRELRDAGKSRADEVLWNNKIRNLDEKFGGLFEPLLIMTFWLPFFLVVAWTVITVIFFLN